MTATLLFAAFLAFPAHAVDYAPYWSYASYPEGRPLAGRDGWIQGYASDTWPGATYNGGSYTTSNTDDGSGTWGGTGQAIDNWIVNEEVSCGQCQINVPFYPEDNDSLGIVLNMVDDQNYYLFVATGVETSRGHYDQGVSPIDGGNDVSCSILRIMDGKAVVLGQVDEAPVQYALGQLSFTRNDNTLTLSYWRDATNTAGTPDITLTADDPAPLGAGAAGFYA